jgi:hypothetical protein
MLNNSRLYHYIIFCAYAIFLCSAKQSITTLTNTTIIIPTVNYFPLLTNDGPKGTPRLNVSKVNYNDIVNVTHSAVIMENNYLKVILLPAMGRVYRMIDKTTGNDLLWKNSIAAPNGANNDLGWWIWIGGIEYTLPGEEHGYTWALKWDWYIDEKAGAVVTQIIEPTTGIVEILHFSLGDHSISLKTDVVLNNPSVTKTASYAHWTNVPFVPGPKNVLPDTTEFIIPTKSIHIDPRWQKNLGNETQEWLSSPLRYIKNWINGTKMGDLTSNGIEKEDNKTGQSFFGVYSHEDQEGGVRIFDVDATPGCDTWTYGFHPPSCFPQNNQIAIGHCSYAEMWGGTVNHLEKLKTLSPGETLMWSERVQPYHGTRGITFANSYFIANVWREHNDYGESGDENGSLAVVALSFNIEQQGITISIGKSGEMKELGDVTPENVVLKYYNVLKKGDMIYVFKSGKVIIGCFKVKV